MTKADMEHKPGDTPQGALLDFQSAKERIEADRAHIASEDVRARLEMQPTINLVIREAAALDSEIADDRSNIVRKIYNYPPVINHTIISDIALAEPATSLSQTWPGIRSQTQEKLDQISQTGRAPRSLVVLREGVLEGLGLRGDDAETSITFGTDDDGNWYFMEHGEIYPHIFLVTRAHPEGNDIEVSERMFVAPTIDDLCEILPPHFARPVKR